MLDKDELNFMKGTSSRPLKRKSVSEEKPKKPVELMEYLIKTYSNEGDTILDFTCGSGSTLVACVNTNRNGIGIEKELKYYNISKDRVSEAEKEKRSKLF